MYLKSIIPLLLIGSLSLVAETGDAGWYGEKFQGKPTASGEVFDMNAYTAAHKTLAFGTILTVTNISNNKSVEVRINDRGPQIKNRILDLSYKAAKEIGMIKEGIVKVHIEKKPDYRPKENSYKINNIKIQIAAFSQKENAESFIKEESEYNYNMQIVSVYSKTTTSSIYKVVILCDSKKSANNIINSKQYKGAYLIRS